MDDTAVCARCGQPIHRPITPWDTGDFHSEWVNAFGFPWCPGKGELEPHTPKDEDEEEKS